VSNSNQTTPLTQPSFFTVPQKHITDAVHAAATIAASSLLSAAVHAVEEDAYVLVDGVYVVDEGADPLGDSLEKASPQVILDAAVAVEKIIGIPFISNVISARVVDIIESSIYGTANTNIIHIMDDHLIDHVIKKPLLLGGMKDWAQGEIATDNWKKFVKNLNAFIKAQSNLSLNVQHREVCPRFLTYPYTSDKIESKLMFYIWDSVFSQDKSPLNTLLGLTEDKDKLVTFSDFTAYVNLFIANIDNNG